MSWNFFEAATVLRNVTKIRGSHFLSRRDCVSGWEGEGYILDTLLMLRVSIGSFFMFVVSLSFVVLFVLIK